MIKEPEDKLRHSVSVMIILAIDLFLAVCACLQLAFVVPVFGGMFGSFGAQLPRATQFQIRISNALTAFHGLGFCLLAGFVLWMIMRMFVVLHRRGDNAKLDAGLRLVLFSSFVLMGIMTAIMFLPVFKMGIVSQ